MDCDHKNHLRGLCYDYCPDCGAVREAGDINKPYGEWHSCDLCKLPQEFES